MGWVDRLVWVVSPQKAYEREAWRQALRAMQGYDASQYDRINSGWTPISNQSAEMTDKGAREIIRARARELERNSDVFGGIITAMERNVVGKGITLQAKTGDEALNKQLEELWKLWSKPRNCDVKGELSFSEMIRMIVRRDHVDGGILTYKSYTKNGILPLQLQLIEVDELDDNAVKPHFAGNTVVAGVERNRFGRPVGYHIRQYLPDGSPGMQSRFVAKDDIIFYHKMTRPSQIREMSPMAPTISRIRDITSYMEAVSVKERIAACLGVLIKKQTPTNGPGRSSQKLVDSSSGYNGVTTTPGMILTLQPGEDAQIITPPNSGGNTAEHVKLQQRLAGAGQGLSYEATSRDMSETNYSSARQGRIEDDGTYGIDQQNLIDHVLTEVYESFVISAVMSGAVQIPGFWRDKHAYLAHRWMPQAVKWIDPLKEANANKIALATRQKTFQQICSEQGRDWKEVIDEFAEAQAYAKEKGVDLNATVKTTANHTPV